MQKDSTIITIISIIFIIVLITTVVLSIKYINQSTQEASQPNNQEVIVEEPTITDSQSNNLQDIIEIEHTPGNDYIDLYLTNSINLSALEFEIILPEQVSILNLTDQDLFYDFVHNQNGNILKVGALSLQVVSPKERHRFLRIFFDRPINEQLNITSQIFIDQQGNEI